MQNKELTSDMIEFLIKEADAFVGGRCGYGYGGRVIVGEHLKKVRSRITVDIVDSDEPANKKGNRKTQGIYKSLLDWLRDHKPVTYQNTIYFMGDVTHDTKGKELPVHWNCLVIFPNQQIVVVYNPSLFISKKGEESGYNFNGKKIDTFLEGVNLLLSSKYTVVPVLPSISAQQVCDPLYMACDIFCQSWVVCFASALMCGKEFVRVYLNEVNYEKYQNQPLKMWLRCVLSEMEGWKQTLKKPEYQLFQKYSRMNATPNSRGGYDDDAYIVELPPIHPEPKRKRGESEIPCIVSMLRHYSGK
jgi:hypothetical protein